MKLFWPIVGMSKKSFIRHRSGWIYFGCPLSIGGIVLAFLCLRWGYILLAWVYLVGPCGQTS
jgi:hypothetical protein